MSNQIDRIKFDLVLKTNGQILLDEKDLIVLYDTKLKSLYIKGHNLEALKTFNIDQVSYDSLVVDDEEIFNYLKELYPEFFTLGFYTHAYLRNEKIALEDYDFRVLDHSFYDLVREYYEYASDSELVETFKNKQIFGLFVEDEIVGFIGMHQDKTMGMLHVFEKYRGHNYGYILEANLINYLYDHHEIIYCDVIDDNLTSMHIQAKLGLEKADKKQYWLFKDE